MLSRFTWKKIGDRLARESDRPELNYVFQVVRDDSINAFATAGGFVYIHTGLIEAAENEAELASVIGHEIAHITNRHALKQIRNRAIQQRILTEAGIEDRRVVQLGVEVAFNLRHSRGQEYEADEDGLRFLGDAGYAEGPMIDFFQKLAGGGRSREWLSTHPDTEKRIERLQASIDPNTAYQGDGLDASDYRRQISRLP